MKKLILSVGVAVTFIAYSLILRHQHSEPIVAPATLSQNSQTSSARSTAATTTTPATSQTSEYKDGTYDGSVDSAFYGNVQVSATIQGGKLAAVNFLEYPNENPNSIYVNQTAIPYLRQEAIKAQSAKVDTVTGATLTSNAFSQSLADALSQAKFN